MATTVPAVTSAASKAIVRTSVCPSYTRTMSPATAPAGTFTSKARVVSPVLLSVSEKPVSEAAFRSRAGLAGALLVVKFQSVPFEMPAYTFAFASRITPRPISTW